MARTASIGIRVEPDLKADIEREAKRDGRTVAQWIERLSQRAVDGGHYYPPSDIKNAAQRGAAQNRQPFSEFLDQVLREALSARNLIVASDAATGGSETP